MRKLKILLLCIVLSLMLTGCIGSSKREVKKAISSELNLLKDLDAETAQKYISYSDLFTEDQQTTNSAEDLSDMFVLYFKNFNYKIHEITINDDNASAVVTITCLDAKALASDFKKALIQNSILSDSSEDSESGTMPSVYSIMIDLLKENNYDSVHGDYTLNLNKTGEIWQLEQSYQTENSIVGGLVSYISDPYLVSPEDTLDVYLKVFKFMTSEEMSNFLGIESILTTEDENKNAIAEELVFEVNNLFNYEIKDSTINGNNASVTVSITTFDSDTILELYNEKAEEYLATADAVIDGEELRQEQLNELLLDAIKESSSVVSNDALFHLSNDGVSWKLNDPSDELGGAVFGSLTSSPTETETDSEQ